MPRETPRISTSFDMVHDRVSNHAAASECIARYVDPGKRVHDDFVRHGFPWLGKTTSCRSYFRTPKSAHAGKLTFRKLSGKRHPQRDTRQDFCYASHAQRSHCTGAEQRGKHTLGTISTHDLYVVVINDSVQWQISRSFAR